MCGRYAGKVLRPRKWQTFFWMRVYAAVIETSVRNPVIPAERTLGNFG